MEGQGTVSLSGKVTTRLIRASGPGLAWKVKNWLRWSQVKSLIGVFVVNPIANLFGLMTAYGKLEAVLIRANGERVRYGVLSYRVVTTAFVDFVTDQLQTETSAFGDLKYHDSGVGTTDPAITGGGLRLAALHGTALDLAPLPYSLSVAS